MVQSAPPDRRARGEGGCQLTARCGLVMGGAALAGRLHTGESQEASLGPALVQGSVEKRCLHLTAGSTHWHLIKSHGTPQSQHSAWQLPPSPPCAAAIRAGQPTLGSMFLGAADHKLKFQQNTATTTSGPLQHRLAQVPV